LSSKRQTTMAKLQRERRIEEKRTLKREKKQAAAAARRAGELPEGAVEYELDENGQPIFDENGQAIPVAAEHDPDASGEPEAGAADAQPEEISANLDRE
jgi:hypothetical protein